MDEIRKERIRELYPTRSDDELEEAATNLDAYIEVAWEIYEDMKAKQPEEPKAEKKVNPRPVDSIQRKFDSP